jgi:RND family efflux transporter MFP subunit
MFSILAGAALLLAAGPETTVTRAAEAAPAAPNVLAVPAVSVQKAAPRELTALLVVTGTLVPRDEVLVSAELDGSRVVEILADEGDSVKAGQVLARLSRETLDAQLAQNDAALARADAAIAQARSQIAQADPAVTEANASLARAEALRKSGNATQEQYDQRLSLARSSEARLAAARDGLAMAQAERASQDAQRRELLVKLGHTEIKAPVEGLISRRSVKLGAISAASGDPMFRIIAGNKVELEAEVLETQLPQIKQGATVMVTPAGAAPVRGEVRLVPSEVDRVTRLGKMRVALPQSPDLRIGSFARGEVDVAHSNGIAVPTSAVLFGGGRPRVLVVQDGKVTARDVVPGISANGWTSISSGLAEGEDVIAKAAPFLREGDQVRVVPVAAEADAKGTQ